MSFTESAKERIGFGGCEGVGENPCVWKEILGPFAPEHKIFFVDFAHKPGEHRSYVDPDPSHGIRLCVICHAKQHYLAGDPELVVQILGRGVFTWSYLRRTGGRQWVLTPEEFVHFLVDANRAPQFCRDALRSHQPHGGVGGGDRW